MGNLAEDRLPLTLAQQGVWIGQQLAPKSPFYNAAEWVEIRGPLDTIFFEEALRQAVAEAEVLHVRFAQDGRNVVQIFQPPASRSLPIIDVSKGPDPGEAARKWMQADLETLVDLGQGPLFAHALFIMGPDRFVWYHRAHHIALDGYSFSLIANRVADLYTAQMTGRASNTRPFGPLRSVVEEDLVYRSSTRFDEDRAFWSAYFADRPIAVSLSDRTSVPCGRLLRQSGRLPLHVMATLRAVADQARATWVEVVIALVAIYVQRCTQAREVILGIPVMGRLGSVSARVPAMTMNIMALRVTMDKGAPLLEVVRTVTAEMRKTRPHQRYRGEHLRRDLKLLGGGRRVFGPMVNVMPFDYNLGFGGHRSIAHNLSAGAQFVEDIAILLHARSDGGEPLAMDIDANPSCYNQAELITHLNNITNILSDIPHAQ